MARLRAMTGEARRRRGARAPAGGQFAAGRDPGGATGLGEEHQRQQPGRLAVVRQERADQAGEPDRLGGQVVTHRIGAGAGGQVALVEDEEQHGQDAGDAGLDRERRVTAGEDQPEPLVADRAGRFGGS
jgi:hypothetical protein